MKIMAFQTLNEKTMTIDKPPIKIERKTYKIYISRFFKPNIIHRSSLKQAIVFRKEI